MCLGYTVVKLLQVFPFWQRQARILQLLWHSGWDAVTHHHQEGHSPSHLPHFISIGNATGISCENKCQGCIQIWMCLEDIPEGLVWTTASPCLGKPWTVLLVLALLIFVPVCVRIHQVYKTVILLFVNFSQRKHLTSHNESFVFVPHLSRKYFSHIVLSHWLHYFC